MSSLGSSATSDGCSNCGRPLGGDRFCGACGQRATDHRQPLRLLMGELQDQVFAFDARSWRTLVALIRRPGLLTVEFNAGHRVRFVPPVRLYLLISFFFFIAIQVSNQQIVTFSSSLSLPEDQGVVETLDLKPESRVVVTTPEGPSDDPIEDPAAAPVGGPEAPAEAAAEGAEDRGLLRFSLSHQMERAELRYDDPVAEINKLVNRRVPQAMFFLVPMMALILKVVYWRRRKYYIEHLVFAVHAHAAIFFALLVAILLSLIFEPLWQHARLIGVPIILGMALHFFKSLRLVYQQSRLMTACKWVVIAFAYLVNLGLALIAVFLVSLYLI